MARRPPPLQPTSDEARSIRRRCRTSRRWARRATRSPRARCSRRGTARGASSPACARGWPGRYEARFGVDSAASLGLSSGPHRDRREWSCPRDAQPTHLPGTVVVESTSEATATSGARLGVGGPRSRGSDGVERHQPRRLTPRGEFTGTTSLASFSCVPLLQPHSTDGAHFDDEILTNVIVAPHRAALSVCRPPKHQVARKRAHRHPASGFGLCHEQGN